MGWAVGRVGMAGGLNDLANVGSAGAVSCMDGVSGTVTLNL